MPDVSDKALGVRWLTSEISVRGSTAVALLLCLAMLTACTARWQAPLETRGQQIPQIKANSEFYRVRPGDNLAGIASAAGTDWRTLARWNRLGSPYTIKPGQLIRLAPPSKLGPVLRTDTAKAKPARRPAATKYAVKPTTKSKRKAPAPSGSGALRWVWPTQGEVLVAAGAKDPSNRAVRIKGKLGQAIRAAESGQVVYSGSGLIGYGRLIILKHNDNYLSAYGHNRKLLAKEGDRVTKGDRIAEMGKSNGGRPLLHFEIRRDGKTVDPLGLLPRSR